jgi:hypothetical protein
MGAACVNRTVDIVVTSSARAQLGWWTPDDAEAMRTW